MATLTLVPPLPAQDTPLTAKGIARVAEAMFSRGVPVASVRAEPALAKFIAPLQALYAGRPAP